LGCLATYYEAVNDIDRAISSAERALDITERLLGPSHPQVARALNNLMIKLVARGDREQEEPLLRRAIGIIEAAHGAAHPSLVPVFTNLAGILARENRLDEAEAMLLRALRIQEASNADHPDMANILSALATVAETGQDLPRAFEL